MCPTRCLQQKEGPGPQELGCCSPRPGRRQTSKLRGEKWKQRPGSSLPCSSQHAPLQADGEHHYGLGCSSPSEEGMICTVSSSALPLGTQWLCFMVNKHCTRDSWLQWRDGELMICCSSGGCAQCPVPSPSMWGVLCDPTARHFSFWLFSPDHNSNVSIPFQFPTLASNATWQLQPLMSILCSTSEVASEAVTGTSCSSVPPPLHLPAEL